MSDWGLGRVCQIWSSNHENVRKSNQEPPPPPTTTTTKKKVSDTRGPAKTRELIYDNLDSCMVFLLAFLSNLSIEM